MATIILLSGVLFAADPNASSPTELSDFAAKLERETKQAEQEMEREIERATALVERQFASSLGWYSTAIFLGMAVNSIVCGCVAGYIASFKGRANVGYVFGALLGPLGCVVTAIWAVQLPEPPRPSQDQRSTPLPAVRSKQ
jgi:hypothetical protein